MQVISKICLDNSLFHFAIKPHQAPPPTHLVLFVVRRIPAQEVLIKSEQITKIYSYSCTVCFMLMQSSATDTEFWLGGMKLESCASN